MSGGVRSPSSTSGAEIRCRSAVATPIRRLRFTDHIAASLWFVPAVVGAAALVVSPLLTWIDRRYDVVRIPSWLFSGDNAAAAQVTTTLTAAILAFLAVVFSTTLVAVQLASSQYSPRIVRVFVRSRVTQATMATFLATFVVSLNAMAATRGRPDAELPELTVAVIYLLVLATVAMFVVFFHRIVRLLRVEYLFLSISDEARKVIEREFPDAAVYSTADLPDPDPDAVTVVHHGAPGVIQGVDLGGLAAALRGGDAWVEVLVAVGGHVGYRTPIARVHHLDGHDPGGKALGAGRGPREVSDRFDRFVLFGGVRTQLQDPGSGIRQLADAACRALSPAVNDPTTAVQAAHRISDLLARIADRPDPTGWYCDADGVARVRTVEDDFERLAELGFTEITRYGADSPQVARCLRAIFRDLATLTDGDRRLGLRRLERRLDESVDAAMPPAFRDLARRADALGLG